MYQHVKVPQGGQKITVNKDYSLNVPDQPIIPYIEGDGTGYDITPVMIKVVDAAVAPERPVFPQPTLWIAGGFLLGAVGSIAFLLLRRAWLESA